MLKMLNHLAFWITNSVEYGNRQTWNMADGVVFESYRHIDKPTINKNFDKINWFWQVSLCK